MILTAIIFYVFQLVTRKSNYYHHKSPFKGNYLFYKYQLVRVHFLERWLRLPFSDAPPWYFLFRECSAGFIIYIAYTALEIIMRNQRTMCPHCKQTARIRTSRQISDTCRELVIQCMNLDCGFIGQATMAFDVTLSPPANPDPSINIPISAHAQKLRSSKEKPAISCIKAH